MKNNHIYKILLIVCSIFFMVNCGGNKGPDLSPEVSRKTLKNAPKWFIDTPDKEGYKYTTATATSQDMQLAVNKARLDAAQTLAGQVSSEMNGLVKRAQEETGLGADSDLIDQFSQTQEQVITTSLKDWKVSEKEIQEEKSNNQNIYRAYVLMELNEADAQKRFLERIKVVISFYKITVQSESFW